MRFLVQMMLLGMICLLMGCTHVTVQVLSNGKLMMYVPKGTKVDWVDENNHAIKVTFPFAYPCKEGQGGGQQSTCTVNHGQAIYECVNGICQDPGIGVRPTTGGSVQFDLRTKVPQGTAKLYQVYCASGKATADGPVVNYNDVVSFVPDADKKFTLSGFGSPSACDPSTITNGQNCTVVLNQSIDVTFQVQYAACTTQMGTGTLHIKQMQ